MDPADAAADHGEGAEGMKITAETFNVMARHSMENAINLAEQFKRGEITEEEQREGIRDDAGFWACLYSPEEIAMGEKLWGEESKQKLVEEYRKRYGAGTALKDLKGNAAIDRLKCIPSEIETIFYLHDTGKVLFDGGRDFANAVNYYDGIDVAFMDQEETERGITNLAGGDAKNTQKQYDNFIIETQLKNKWSGEWSTQYSWGKHVLNPNNRNRYIFYVRGNDFGQYRLIDRNKSERENALRILAYYYEHPEKLDHIIEIIRAEDVRKFLAYYPEEKENSLTEYCIGYLLDKTKWIAAGLPALRVTKSADGWTETQMNASNPLTIQTAKYQTRGDISKLEKQLRADQAEGLSLSLLKSLFGLPDEIWTEAEINERAKQQQDY